MTRGQMGEKVISLPMSWVEEAQSQAGRLDYKETGHDVRFLAVRWVEEAQSVAGRQDDKKTSC